MSHPELPTAIGATGTPAVLLKSSSRDGLGEFDGSFGGLPSLPDDVAWPMGGEDYLSFLGELPSRLLRRLGWSTSVSRLLIFCDTLSDLDIRNASVLIIPEDASGGPRACPVDATGVHLADEFEFVGLRATDVTTYPLDDFWKDPLLAASLEAIVETLDPRTTPQHRLGGYPYSLQEPVLDVCKRHTALDYELFFQVDTDSIPGFSWMSGSGRLYFLIPKGSGLAGLREVLCVAQG